MGLKILHLSDLHIGEEKRAYTMEDLAGKILLSQNEAPDIIIVTGDIFDAEAFSKRNYKKIINEAINFFEYLIEKIEEKFKEKFEKKSIYFLPGNHELERDKIEKQDIFSKYKKFLEGFYKKLPEFYSKKTYSFIKDFSQEKVIIIGFNSNSFSLKKRGKNKKENEYFGEISIEQFLEMSTKIKEIKNYEEKNVVVALHHHFYTIEERDKKYVDNSVLRNSEAFFEELKKYNVCAILHGHKHESLNRRINISLGLKDKDKIVTVLGCGTTSKDDNQYNNFNFIDIFPFDSMYDLKYEEFEYTRSNFKSNGKLLIPIDKNKTKIIIALKEEIEKNPELSQRYKTLKAEDVITENGLDDMLNEVVCSLSGVSEHIYKDPEILFYLLGAIHYRANIKRENNHIYAVEEFIKFSLDTHFEKNLDEIYKILKMKDINKLHPMFTKVKMACENEKQKKYLIFLLLGIILSEFYFILKYESEEFFNKKIKNKANFQFRKGEIIQGITGNSIEFKSNEDRRSLGILIKCKNAISHKVSSLMIKEFELILNQFENDFSVYGFNIYYVFPEILKQTENKKIESYNFSAYIPTLIPLLAGRNIYKKPEAFARELIQNSLDAINVYKSSLSNNTFEPRIDINLDTRDGEKYFEITDNGIGMNKYVLERYLTTVGRSFYKSDDYEKLNISYKPISQFGIGFLSCFILGKHVTVETKYYESEDSYLLDIPNFDGCFFIENIKKQENGTKICIYENPELKKEGFNFDFEEIKNYIKANILNINCSIYLNNEMFIPKANLEKKLKKETSKYKVFFHIYLKYCNNMLEIDNTKTSPYGIYFYKKDNKLFEKSKVTILNYGVLIEDSENVQDNFFNHFGNCFDICANFHPNILKLEVSRDRVTGFHGVKFEDIKNSLDKKLNEKKLLKVPYLYLYKMDNKKYPLPFISFSSQSKISEIGIELKKSNIIDMIKDFIIKFNSDKKFEELNFKSLLGIICIIDLDLERKRKKAKKLGGMISSERMMGRINSVFNNEEINKIIKKINIINKTNINNKDLEFTSLEERELRMLLREKKLDELFSNTEFEFLHDGLLKKIIIKLDELISSRKNLRRRIIRAGIGKDEVELDVSEVELDVSEVELDVSEVELDVSEVEWDRRIRLYEEIDKFELDKIKINKIKKIVINRIEKKMQEIRKTKEKDYSKEEYINILFVELLLDFLHTSGFLSSIEKSLFMMRKFLCVFYSLEELENKIKIDFGEV